jgi:hypothetical protein
MAYLAIWAILLSNPRRYGFETQVIRLVPELRFVADVLLTLHYPAAA